MARAVLLDIEGTTTDIAFVHDVLFPYARERLADFLRAHADDPEVAEQIRAVRREAGEDLDLSGIIETLKRWIDEDRKATPLKALQGMIWAQGYADGSLRAHVYPEVSETLRRWKDAGLDLYIYSSGSEQAQRLLFAHTEAGDLTPLFSGYFDTRIGHKREPESYRRISEAIGLPPGEILFLSDVPEELDAAHAAGLKTVQVVRDTRTRPAPGHPQVTRLDEIDPRQPPSP